MISEYQAIVQNGFCTNTPVQSLQRIWDVLPQSFREKAVPIISPCVVSYLTEDKHKAPWEAETDSSSQNRSLTPCLESITLNSLSVI